MQVQKKFSTNLIHVLHNPLPQSMKGAYNSRTFTFSPVLPQEKQVIHVIAFTW